MDDYTTSVRALDDSVGFMSNFLDSIDETDNTLIIYTSTNGFFLGEHGFYDKRFMYEETMHIPLIVQYPPIIKRGRVSIKQAVWNIFTKSVIQGEGLFFFYLWEVF